MTAGSARRSPSTARPRSWAPPRAYDTGRADAVTASDGWTGPLGLAGANPHEDTEFGTAVASSGTTVLVGAPVLRAGSGAYLFDC